MEASHASSLGSVEEAVGEAVGGGKAGGREEVEGREEETAMGMLVRAG